jgi:hypothetical protein
MGVRLAPHPAARLQPLKQLAERRKLHIKFLGKIALPLAVLTVEMSQDEPLGARDSTFLCTPVEASAQQAGHVVGQEPEVAFEIAAIYCHAISFHGY